MVRLWFMPSPQSRRPLIDSPAIIKGFAGKAYIVYNASLPLDYNNDNYFVRAGYEQRNRVFWVAGRAA